MGSEREVMYFFRFLFSLINVVIVMIMMMELIAKGSLAMGEGQRLMGQGGSDRVFVLMIR